ncbi:substrate-binding domain-containing protein [Candidatus Nanopelagicales bacterium]|jgi:simple sugar transport system substrate-binding protein|nr:substrate-binding domain-containing protein [Candidatus Nanopelagicales bacterium]
MKVGKLAIAAVAASALVLAGCSSSDSDSAAESTDDAAASEGSGDSGGGENSQYKICMVTHGDGGGFWSVAKAGADRAAQDLGVDFTYQETTNDAQLQAQLIEGDVSAGCQGIAVSAPNPDAIEGALQAAEDAGVSIVTMNSGSAVFKDLGAFTHVGQDEFIAGQEAGLKFKEAGVTKVLCPIQEQNNIGLQERCDGAADTFGNVENLQLSAGLADLAQSQAEIQAALEADPEIDGIFALNADIATAASMPAAEAVGRDVMVGTVDLSGDAVQAIADGELAFAIDQQQYAQGYMSVVLLYLNLMNGHELGGGQPMYTGPGFVVQENAELVQELASNGTR